MRNYRNHTTGRKGYRKYSGKNRFKNNRGRSAKGIVRSKRHRLHAFYK